MSSCCCVSDQEPTCPCCPLQPTCRLCFGHGEAGLVCPCQCTGSIKYIHLDCLQQWQRTLWQSGQFRRAMHCDVCQQPYQQLFMAFPLEQRVPLIAKLKQLAVQLYHNPDLAFKAWRCCILLGGLAAGTHRGMSGFKAGLHAGVKSAKPLAALTLKLMPQLSIIAAVLPHLQPLLCKALHCSCAVMAAEVALASAAGLLCGGLLGFCLGTVGVVRMTAVGSCQAAALAASLARKVAASKGGIREALIAVLLKMRAPC